MSIAGMLGKGLGYGIGAARVGGSLARMHAGKVGGMTNLQTIGGALAGGMYGAMSDNTSVLGGAAMGAGLARYGGSAIRGAMKGHAGSFLPGMRPGVATTMRMAARGAFRQAKADGLRSYRTIGRTMTKARGKINSLKTTTGKGMPPPGQMSLF